MDIEFDDETECKPDVRDLVGESSDLNLEALTIMRKVLKMCRIECERNKLTLPLVSYIDRFRLYTGYPITVLPEKNIEAAKKISRYFDINERIIIIKALLSFYQKKETPTLLYLYHNVAQLSIPTFDQFCGLMHLLGFHYLPTTTGWIVSEDPKLKFKRFHYLNNIKKYRLENKPICYIDERIITSAGDIEKIDDLHLTNQKDDQLFFLSALSNAEVKCSLFCNTLSKDLFKRWIFGALVKVIEPDTVIIFNNSKLHGELTQTAITPHHSKQDMIKYLRFNNVPCYEDMHKAELYELTQRIPKDDKSYDIDKFFQGFDCNVLRLPFNCNNLSITELMWKELEMTGDKRFENKQPFVVSDQLLPRISSIIKDRWKQYEQTIINWENEIMNLDIITEAELEKTFKFDVEKITSQCSTIL